MQGGSTQAEPALEHAFSGASVPGGSVLEGRPVSVPSEQSRPPQGMPFIPAPTGPQPDMAQGGSPSARPTGPFGQGIQQMQPVQPVQLKGDPAAGMTPISMPSNYPSWQPQHPMNGMHGGQLAMHGSPMGNGGPISTGAPGGLLRPGSLDAVSSAAIARGDVRLGTAGPNKSRYRGVSYDKKKRKWRVQIKVATLGKSGVSVGYYDTEEAAARAYDRAAIGLLGRNHSAITTNFPMQEYDKEPVPQLIGKSREEVKATLKSERAKVPRRRFSSRQRTSRFMGVGSSNRKNQWQARILVHGKVTHLGYYETEEEAARVYDRVSISLHGPHAQTNYPAADYEGQECGEFQGLAREELQRALGVKPMDKSSRFRGVSKKKGKWEAKVMVNRKWAYRELFDSEEEAARAYDDAVWRLKPKEAKSYINFKERFNGDRAGRLHRPRQLSSLRITPNSSDSQKTSDSPSRSASFGLRPGLPPLSPMSGDVSGRMLRASDLVRAHSSASSEEVGNMLGRRHSSGIMPSPLPSSLLKGLEPSQSPSPEMSHEEALSKPHGFQISLPGQRAATESPESSADGLGHKGLGGFTAISSGQPGSNRGGMPKSASTSHLSGMHYGTPKAESARNDAGFTQTPPPEGHQVQMQRMPNNRMFRTMSVPHMPMGPGQQQSMYGTYDEQGGYFLPLTSGFSTIPEVPGQPFHMSGGVTSRSLRHSASAMDLPRSGGMPAPLHEGFPMFGPGAAMGPLSNMSHFGNPRAPQGMSDGAPGRMIRVGSEQHFVTDQPQHHHGPPTSGPQRPYSPGAASMPSPLIGGLNGSLGSRVTSGLLDPSTPRGSRSSLDPAAQGSPGQNAAGRGHQASDMQVCSAFTSLHSTHDLPTTMLDPSTPRGSRSSLNPAAQGSSGQNAAGRGHQASDMQVDGEDGQRGFSSSMASEQGHMRYDTPIKFNMMPGGMPKSFSHSNLPMHYSGPSMMPYQGTMAPSRWMGQEGPGEATAWLSDYGVPGSSPLTGMGQRSVSASNLAAMGSLPPDFLNSQAHLQSGANLVKSASVSNLGGLCKHYSGQPFTAQLPTLAKAPDGLGPSPSPGPMDGNSSLLDDLNGNAMVTEGNMEDCPSPLRAVQIGGEDLTMFDGTAVATDGSEFLLEPDLGA